jgi:prophage regulatory protein
MSNDLETAAILHSDAEKGSRLKLQRLIRLAEVKQRVGLSRASIYKRMSEGRFPKSRSLGTRCAVWIESEIDAWISEVANGRPETKQRSDN